MIDSYPIVLPESSWIDISTLPMLKRSILSIHQFHLMFESSWAIFIPNIWKEDVVLRGLHDVDTFWSYQLG